MRIAIGLEYDGSRFRGWQVQQPGVATVQGALEKAVARVAAHPVTTVCAGRTDAGVHGMAQVVHFDTAARRPDHAWVMGGNSHLPPAVSIQWARPVGDDFHARFTATARRYRYVILNRPQRSALAGARFTFWYRPLEADIMHRAGQCLLGERDFSSFRAAECQSRSPMRRVDFLEVRRRGDFVVLEIEANAFLHHMVRNIAGVLMAIGEGKRPEEWCREVLERRDRTQGGVTAPGEGLYLTHVRYPERFGLPETTSPLLELLP